MKITVDSILHDLKRISGAIRFLMDELDVLAADVQELVSNKEEENGHTDNNS